MSARLRPPRIYSFNEWKSIIQEWKESGLSKDDYCRERRITKSTFRRWFIRVKDFSSKDHTPQSYIHSPDLCSSSKNWKELYEDWKDSELSIPAYCKKRGLSSSTFRVWIYKFDPSLQSRKTNGSTVKKRQSPRYYTQEQWQEIVEDWEKSGLSRIEYCRRKNIGETALFNWSQKLLGLDRCKQALQNAHRNKLRVQLHKEKCKDLTLSNSFQNNPSLQTSKPKSSLQDLFIPITLKPDPVPVMSSKDSSKVEVTLSGGHKLLIQGSFDWDNVMTLLTPLLT